MSSKGKSTKGKSSKGKSKKNNRAGRKKSDNPVSGSARLRKPAITTLARRAGVISISSNAVKEVRRLAASWTEEHVKDAIAIAVYRGQSTIKPSTAIAALAAKGITLASGLEGLKKYSMPKKAASEEGEAAKGPGAGARVRFAQRRSNSTFVFPDSSFRRYIKEDLVPKDETGEATYHVGRNAALAIQLAVEHRIYQLIKDSSAVVGAEKAEKAEKVARRVKDRHVLAAYSIKPPHTSVSSLPQTKSFNNYLTKLVKGGEASQSVLKGARTQLNNLAVSLIGRTIQIVNTVIAVRGAKTANTKAITMAVEMLLPVKSKLAKDAVAAGNAAVTKYTAGKAAAKGKGSGSRAELSGLTLSVPRVKRLIKASLLASAPRLSGSGDVFLTGVIEHIISNVLKSAGAQVQKSKRVRIGARQVLLAIREDAELNDLFPEFYYVLGGGVVETEVPKTKTHRKSRKGKGGKEKKSKAAPQQ